MKGNARLGFILAMFAAVGCGTLAVVQGITAPAIAMQSEKALNESLTILFPEAASFEDITETLKPTSETVSFEKAYLVKSAAAPLGVAVKAVGSSYGGTAKLLVGVSLTRSIAGVSVLQLADTAGLGQNAMNDAYYVNKAEKITFPGQFKGKYLTDAFEVKKDVVAITAATISSKALTGIVKIAADAAAAWLENQTSAGAAPTDQAAAAASGAPAQAGAAPTGGK